MTSHAALVARGWGKCCIVGAGTLHVDSANKTAEIPGSGTVLKEGEVVTLNGTRGHVFVGSLPMIDASENPRFQRFMTMADKYRKMGVRTNADTAEDARVARNFGAEGIGLFRTEHMFYGEGSDEPLFCLRKMSSARAPGRAALGELFPFSRSLKGTMEAVEDFRLRSASLIRPFTGSCHRAQRSRRTGQGAGHHGGGSETGRISQINLMGHRGIRLDHLPGSERMQIRAIFQCAAGTSRPASGARRSHSSRHLRRFRAGVHPENVERVHTDVLNRFGLAGLAGLEYKYGTMVVRVPLLPTGWPRVRYSLFFGTSDRPVDLWFQPR